MGRSKKEITSFDILMKKVPGFAFVVKSLAATGKRDNEIEFIKSAVGNIPAKDMHGVVAITKIGGDIIEKSGKSAGILLAALISMNLAILNILPIPALDGGHLMFMLIEKIMGRPLDEKIIEKISSVFFMLLIILMIFIVFNDITLLVKK